MALTGNANGKIQFVAREHIDKLERERDLKTSGQVTGGDKLQGNEFKGRITSSPAPSRPSQAEAAGASDYVLYTFQLINPNNTDIVWEGFHEIKKQGKDDVTYR